MKILIIEDEARIARRLQRMAISYFEQDVTITICDAVDKGLTYLENNTIDLLLLDLNLNGENGFDLLESVVSKSFHTIIVSAYADRAITAFEYGVLDFVPKPFDEIRLGQAFKRISQSLKTTEEPLRFLAVKKAGNIKLIELKDLLYIKGAGIYSELYLRNGNQVLHDKSLETLAQILPNTYQRIHKSYLVSLHLVERITIQPGSKYELILITGTVLPVGRSKYKELKKRMG